MKSFKGKTLSWEWREGRIELMLDHEPANEIGTAMLEELEVFVGAFGALAAETSSCIIYSARKSVFSAGGDLRELYHQAVSVPEKERPKAIRSFLGAVARGTHDLQTHPGDVSALLKANPDLDPKLQKAAVKLTLPFFQPPTGKPFGYQDPGQWRAFADFMRRNGLIRGSANGAFTNALLPGQGP